MSIRGVTFIIGAGALAAGQFFLGSPVRYSLLTIEFMALAYVVWVLWDRVGGLTRVSAEHQARLKAIAEVASKSQVVNRANRIIDAIMTAQVERGEEEAVDSTA